MKLAVGTSLLIISMKSLIGVLGSMSIAGGVVQVDTGPGTTQPVEWAFLGFFSLAAIGGIIAGSALSRFIPGEKLKPGFGWFMLVMGIYIILSKLL